MTSSAVHVWIDLDGQALRVGTLWPHLPPARGGAQAASFEYDRSWLVRADRFALEPALSLNPGKFQTAAGRTLFGSFGDSAPDRWGRMLMDRAAAEDARTAGRSAPTLFEIDYLLGVNDDARAGALRFATDDNGPFLALPGSPSIPPLVELPALLRAADAVAARGRGSQAALRLLLAPGSSLGGARPKASVRDTNGRLAIAKFPSKQDDYNAVSWEGVALQLAERAGLAVERWRIEHIARKPVLIVQRFDRRSARTRADAQRVPFLSAMSMIGAIEHESHSYLEIADVLRQHGAATAKDLEELWRRIVFTVLISNTDDHLRNHGFLYDATARGWRLAPVYDVNPTPRAVKPRVLSTAIDETNTTASLSLALDVAEYFDVTPRRARQIARAVQAAVREWKVPARKLGLSADEIGLMASAFEHEDLRSSL